MSSPLDIARDEWPALRWRRGTRPRAALVGTGRYGGQRIRVVVWDDGDVNAYGDVIPRPHPVGTVSGLPLRAALRELRRRLG